jgi:hypothetical protein
MTKSGGHARPFVVSTLRSIAWFGALLGAACSDATPEVPCATYACFSDALLSGNASLSAEATLVDVQLCIDGFCHQGTIDRNAPDAGEPCLTWNERSHVCLAPRGPNTVAVDVVSEFAYDAVPHDTSIRLLLTDHDSGSTLLDETRAAPHEITREDNCHRCWQASATL